MKRLLVPAMALFWVLLAFGQRDERNSSSNQSPIRVDVDQVLVTVGVTDSQNKYVAGLKKEDFQVWEDKVRQDIQYFSTEDVPASIGLIFDSSGSMLPKLYEAANAALTFLRMGNRQDEYFLIQFNNTPRLVQDFTSNISDVERSINYIAPGGMTALYDAVYFGLNRVSRGL